MQKQTKKYKGEMLSAEEMRILHEGGCPWPNMKAPKRPSQVSTDEVKHRAIV